MANVQAAIKQIRKDAKKRATNQAVLSELHTLWRRFCQLSDRAQAQSLSQTLTSKWDHAVSRGIVPKGRANRKKARIAANLQRL